MQRTKVVVLVALLAGFGCSKSSSNDPSARDFANEVSSAYEARIGECQGMTAEAARQWMQMRISADNVGEAQDAGRLEYDATKREACLDWIASADCTLLMGADSQSPCVAAFVPKVEEGGDCTAFMNAGISAECIDGECVADSRLSCTTHGQCLTFATEGQPCDVPDYWRDCAPGLACEDEVCVPIVIHTVAGETCESDHDLCADALSCDGSVCQPRVADGQDCGYGTGDCAESSICDYMTGKCLARLDIGADCEPSYYQCKIGAYCDAATSKCAAYPTVGGACGYDGEESRYCVDSWCESPEASPIPAIVSADPVMGTCRAFLNEGDTCEPETIYVRGPSVPDYGQCGPAQVCDSETKKCIKSYCGSMKD